MADFKRRTLLLSTGKQIRLFGNSLAIGKSLEIGEGGAPNIFSCIINPDADKNSSVVQNPYKLTAGELHELADYNIRLWSDFKDNIRQYGITNTKVFNLEVPAAAKKNKSKPKPEKNESTDKKIDEKNQK